LTNEAAGEVRRGEGTIQLTAPATFNLKPKASQNQIITTNFLFSFCNIKPLSCWPQTPALCSDPNPLYPLATRPGYCSALAASIQDPDPPPPISPLKWNCSAEWAAAASRPTLTPAAAT